ncbi:glycosyl hydrolase 53 family protein [Hymenobacter armeniacus]|uniref:Arabinogalactan endo-beta-1,4-galactanase n=1 Tax=Hymenobacter armeniacus TaxID=2771358 RepID=A0ABR8JU41_9BACT|nr:glycosyl hydrolase 53 family protein [Hymenobacter armeniacus]MBD2722042.1 glycosyl hydrolase 53 family protein [Hymenobacter armeniacus]
MTKPVLLFLLLTLLAVFGGGGPAAQAQTPAPFAKGADISWITEMERANYLFYNEAGVQQDLFRLLRDHDMNAIRLRVWVNPAGGWNGKNDVIAKAIRARNLGFRLMIDFHYSDSWADPGQQTKPAAWAGHSFSQLLTDVYNHTYDVLDSLKDNNIVPEWVQVGNETNDGMLWPEGRRSLNPQNFAQVIDRGYAAVKAVNPTSKVIVHIANGFNNAYFRNVFDDLVLKGARFDVIGMSHYPTDVNWPTLNAQIQTNLNDMVARYPGKEVMVVETGMPANRPIPTQQMLLDLLDKVRAVPGGKGLGVLYWEPQAYNWMNYGLGMWSSSGRPTAALNAFLNTPPARGLVYNPGFEYTGATQTVLGWTTTGDADADLTQFYGYSSSYQLGHQRATPYQVRTSQLLTNLPSGTYTLRAWGQSSGGQTQCQLYASGFGGTERATTLPATGNWERVEVPGIVVTNGQCEIGLRSNAHANETASLDDVEFVATAVSATSPAAAVARSVAQVYPNPGTGARTIRFALERAETVQLSLFSLSGQLLRVVQAPRRLAAGAQALQWDAPALAAGTYLLKVSLGDHTEFHKIVQL